MPLHGASTSTRSAIPSQGSIDAFASSPLAAISFTRTLCTPSRRARRLSSSSLRASTSSANSSPRFFISAASCSVFPPAPAQASITFVGGGSTSIPSSCEPSSCSSNSPSRNASSENAFTRVSSITPSGESGVAFASTPSARSFWSSPSRSIFSVFTRPLSGARSFIDSATRSASLPNSRRNRSARNGGSEEAIGNRCERGSASSAAAASGSARRVFASSASSLSESETASTSSPWSTREAASRSRSLRVVSSFSNAGRARPSRWSTVSCRRRSA